MKGARAVVRGLLSFARRWQLTLVLASAPTWTGCTALVQVRAAYDRQVDFSDFKTFAMMLPNRPVQTEDGTDPFVMQRLRQLTYLEMTERGFDPVPKAEADLWVSVVIDTMRRVETFFRSGPGLYGYGAPGFGYYGGPAWGYDVREYEETKIIVDLVDSQSNAVVWQGTGSLRSPVSSDDTLRQVVHEILRRYPPAPAEDGTPEEE